MMTDPNLLNSLLTRSIPRSLRGKVHIDRGTFPTDLEVDDGYPNEDRVAEIAMVSIRRSDEWLRNVFPVEMECLPCASVSVEDFAEWTGESVKRISVSTGGWSGCESVIGAVLDHPIMRMRLDYERRGGHFVFLVPCGDQS